jgi:TRAP-type C4-dicarboxylate transport system permease small subunit
MGFISRLAGMQLMLAMSALVVMGSVTVLDVALKYLFSRPIAGAYDLVESLLPVVIFHGLPATLLRRQNIVIDLVDHMLGAARVKPLVTIANVVMAALLFLITCAMIGPALQAFDYGDRKLELGLLLVFVWALTILGMCGAILVALAVIIHPSSHVAKAD